MHTLVVRGRIACIGDRTEVQNTFRSTFFTTNQASLYNDHAPDPIASTPTLTLTPSLARRIFECGCGLLGTRSSHTILFHFKQKKLKLTKIINHQPLIINHPLPNPTLSYRGHIHRKQCITGAQRRVQFLESAPRNYFAVK